MNEIIIRPCTDDDLEAIFQLDHLWDKEGVAYVFTYGSQEDFTAEYEQFREYYFVADCDGEIVGYINGSVRVNENQKIAILPDQEIFLEIENIYVRSEFRDQRVGGELIERLLGTAERNGIKRFIVSTVTKDMDRIMRFYQSHGFKPWYVELFK
jgi:ribosomal protein S18 acetylase RimI-like enzyme